MMMSMDITRHDTTRDKLIYETCDPRCSNISTVDEQKHDTRMHTFVASYMYKYTYTYTRSIPKTDSHKTNPNSSTGAIYGICCEVYLSLLPPIYTVA